MYRAILITGNSERHCTFAHEVSKYFELAAIISEPTKNYYTEQRRQSKDVEKHFQRLSECEKKHFEKNVFDSSIPIFNVSKDNLNNPDLVHEIIKFKPDIILLYGTGILKEVWLDAFPNKIINLHLGLSPFYRGSATLFWPFYFNELQYLGTTIHIASIKVDAGDILMRVLPDWNRVDKDYYEITNALIKKSIKLYPKIVKQFLNGEIDPEPQDLSVGRYCKRSDFDEPKLKQALNNINQLEDKYRNTLKATEYEFISC